MTEKKRVLSYVSKLIVRRDASNSMKKGGEFARMLELEEEKK